MRPKDPANSSPFNDAAFARLFTSRLSEFQVPWSVFLIRYSATMRRAVGEMDDLLLLVALTVAAAVPSDASDGFTASPGPYTADTPPPPTNAMRLADMTGIPRETVRRRMLAMAARGWVEQSGPPRREWRLAVGPEGWPRVAQEMGAVHEAFLRDVARLLGQWDREARKAGWSSLTQPPPAPSASPLSVPAAAGRKATRQPDG